MSRPYKFEVHTLVTGPFRGVGVVDRNSGAASKGEEERCFVRRRTSISGSSWISWPYHESELTRVSFWRFLFWRNPDGTFQVGYNPLWAFVVACAFFGIIYTGLKGEFGVYAWVLRVLCIGTPIAWLIFTGRQYLGLTR